jgi:hypothetical protein
MAKAKTTPVKEEQKQIVLTQEQFNKLRYIQNAIEIETSTLKDTISDTDLEPIEIGFNIGSAHSSLYDACDQLENLLDSIDPNDEDKDGLGDDWDWEINEK